MFTRLLNVAEDTNVTGVANVGDEFTVIILTLSLWSGTVPRARLEAFSSVMLEPTPANPDVEVTVP